MHFYHDIQFLLLTKYNVIICNANPNITPVNPTNAPFAKILTIATIIFPINAPSAKILTIAPIVVPIIATLATAPITNTQNPSENPIAHVVNITTPPTPPANPNFSSNSNIITINTIVANIPMIIPAVIPVANAPTNNPTNAPNPAPINAPTAIDISIFFNKDCKFDPLDMYDNISPIVNASTPDTIYLVNEIKILIARKPVSNPMIDPAIPPTFDLIDSTIVAPIMSPIIAPTILIVNFIAHIPANNVPTINDTADVTPIVVYPAPTRPIIPVKDSIMLDDHISIF